ncbi:MAG: immunoglobulin-like domain-containing protein [Candidatus Sedimenticola sp. 1PA]
MSDHTDDKHEFDDERKRATKDLFERDMAHDQDRKNGDEDEQLGRDYVEVSRADVAMPGQESDVAAAAEEAAESGAGAAQSEEVTVTQGEAEERRGEEAGKEGFKAAVAETEGEREEEAQSAAASGRVSREAPEEQPTEAAGAAEAAPEVAAATPVSARADASYQPEEAVLQDPSTVSLGATGQITEAGGIVTYTATVDHPPLSDLVITLSNGESITIAAGETSATLEVEVGADEDVYQDASQLSAHVTGTEGGGYSTLSIDTTPAVTQIVDTLDTTTVSLGATGHITEAGGAVTYTASVDHPPLTDLEITLSNGETVTIEAGQTSGTVDVPVAADEDVIADATTMSAHITQAEGGGYEQLAIDANPAVTAIHDTVDTTTVSLGATGQITEAGGSVTYTASVDNAPASDLVITLSNGETITIEAGRTSGSVDLPVAADEDAIADATSLSAHITDASGGGYEQLVIDAGPAVTDIVDTVDTTSVSLGATGQLTEAGGVVTYTANVDNAPVSDLVITLSNGESITIEAGQISGTVDVTVAADEDAIADASTMSAHITDTSGGGYEQLAINANPAVTEIVDTVDTTTLSLGATGQITEAGGTVTYTASVDNAPASDLEITLSNGESITIEAGKTSGTVDVPVAADEDAIADASSLSAQITGTDGGGYEQLAVNETPAVTAVVDTVDTTTVSLGATGQITEAGGTVTYTATVDNAPASDLSITLSNGEVITIAEGHTSATVDVAVAADEDAIADASTMSAHITEASGGGYEQLAVDANPAVTGIIDTMDSTTVSLGATGQITEAGGTVTYTASVDNAPATDLVITLSNGETITIESGQISGTAEITVAADEDATADASSMSAHITDATGGGYEQLLIDANPAVTGIIDTVDTTTVSLGATGQITEAGGSVTYTASVDNAPASDLEITLSNGESITIEAGRTSGTVDVPVAADEDAIADATTLSAHITGTDGGGYEQLAVNANAAVTSIVDTMDTTTVSLDATGEITEAGGTVTYTASVDNAPASDLEITLSNGETITIEQGQTTGTVSVDVAADEDAIADATSMSAHITDAAGGGYEQLAIDANAAVTNIVDTVETTTVSLGATGQITEAGGTVTYTASVDNAPATDMTVVLSNGESIVIEAGQVSGTVDVTVAADEDAIADAATMSAHITEASGGGFENLAVNANPAVTDIVDTVDTTTVSLGATGQITEAGGTVTYTASVDNAPASDLTITLSNGESITIEAGETSGTVDLSVAADEDAIADASSMSAHITSADGGGYEQLNVDATPATTDIIDTQDTTTVSLGATGQITEAGGSVTYTANVDNAPATDLTITLSNGETITIEAGKTSGTTDVAVDADEDAIADAATISAHITDAEGGGYEQLSISPNPAVTSIADTVDTTTVSLGATGQITEAGGTVTYTANVDNAPATDLEVTLSNGETITIEAGETSGTLDVEVAADEDAIADASSMSAHITDTSGGGYEDLAINANPVVTDIVDTADTTTVSLGATGQITEAGGSVTYTATVDNAPASDVTIALSNGESIVIEAGQTSGTVDVTVAADEDAIADATSMSAHITDASGGGFENLAVNANAAVTEVVDTTDTTTVSLGATGQITEAGGSVTYTASVDNAPASDMTIVLSNGESIVIEAGKSSGTVDVTVAADEDAIADATSMSAHITDATGGGYENLAVNAEPAVTDIVDTTDTTTVSLGATGQITEAGGTVTYTASVDNAPASDLVVALSNGESITIKSGQTSGSVDIEVAADEDAIADATAMSAHITGAEGGGYEQLSVNANAAVTGIVDTIDTTTVSLDATGQITEAGGTVTYTASVDNAPASDLEVTLSNGETFTIAAGETSADLDVTVDADAIADATTLSMHITEASGGGYEQLAINAAEVTREIVDLNEAPTDISIEGGGNEWGSNFNGEVFQRPAGGGDWEQAEGLVQVEASADGRVWTLDDSGNIEILNPDGTTLETFSNNYTDIAVNDAGQVWALGGSNGQSIYQWDESSDSWSQVPGRLTEISITEDGAAWGVNAGDRIYTHSYEGGNWSQINGRLSEIAVEPDGTVWGVNSSGRLYHREPGENWQHDGAGYSDVTVDDNGAVLVEKADGSVIEIRDTGPLVTVEAGDASTVLSVGGGLYVDENETGAVVGAVSTTDPDVGDTHTYQVSDSRFEIVDGNLKLKDGESLDHESAESVDVTVTATDSGGLGITETFTVKVIDANDAPIDMQLLPGREIEISNASFEERTFGDQQWGRGAPGWESSGSAGDWNPAERSLSEEAADGQNVAYANNGGALAQTVGEAFSADQHYELSVDVGNRQDIRGHGNYEIRLYAGDELVGSATEGAPPEGGWQTVTLTVDGDDYPEGFAGYGENLRIELVNEGGGQVNFDNIHLSAFNIDDGLSVTENAAGAVVGTLFTSDVDVDDTHTYEISDNRFEVVDGVVKLQDGVSLDHEEAESIDIEVTTTDSGGLSHTETFTVNVADINEGPEDIAFSGDSVTENATGGTVVSTLSATDHDSGETLTYTLENDPSGSFEIVGNQVVVKEGAEIDFESAESHQVTVQVTDSAGNSYSEEVTFTVNDLDEVASTPTLSVSLGEATENVVAGDVDYAIKLNESGNNDGLQIENGGELLAGQDELTITMNVRFDGDGLEDTTPLVSYATDDNNNEFRIELKPKGDDRFELHLDSGGDAEETGKLDNDLLFDGEMHEISISIDANGDISYEIDGNEVATDHFERSKGHEVGDDDGVLIIGQEQDRVGSRFDDDEVFKGDIGDIKIYDTAEVTDETQPVGHWDMNQLDSETGTVADQVGNHDIKVISIDERGFTEGSEPSLVAVGETGGGETTLTYPLNIEASLGDTDGSESLAITVSGIPEDAQLSAGTDNGDGSWSLTTDQLDGLTVTVPSEGAADLDISVTATSTESEGGAQASVSQSIAPEISVESAPAVSAGDVVVSDESPGFDEGWSGEESSDGTLSLMHDSFAEKTFDFGEESAGKTVTLEFDSDTQGSWDKGGRNQDYFDVEANGESVVSTSAKGENHHSVTVTLDENGQVSLRFSTDTTGRDEGVEISDITMTANEDWGMATGEAEAGSAGPTDISFSGSAVVEGAAAGTVVATLQTIDQSTGDTFSYELVRDDSGHFEIVGDQLVVKEGADIDYETDAVHQLSVKVTDSSGNTYSESINIHVDDVQEAMAATYTGGRKGDRFDGTDDDDVIDGIAGDDKLRGGEGDDVILGGGGEDKLYGDEGSDRLDGGDRSDKMYGGEGDDTLIGGEGKDKMYGDEGHDTLNGGEGNDKMYGGEGHDRFVGGEGNDKMYGGEGDDRFVGGEGNDKAEGGAGSDTYEADPFGGSDYFSGGEGGGWTDVIQLNADAVPDGSDPDAPWSIQVDGEQVQYDVADHALSLDPDASGVITFSDGSELTFDGVERIEW